MQYNGGVAVKEEGGGEGVMHCWPVNIGIVPIDQKPVSENDVKRARTSW